MALAMFIEEKRVRLELSAHYIQNDIGEVE